LPFTLDVALEPEETAAKHVFAVESNDGAKVYLNGQLVVDNDGMHAARVRSGAAVTSGGRLRVEYFQNGKSQVRRSVFLEWGLFAVGGIVA